MNGDFKDVYMDIPLGCKEKFGLTKVCKYKKSLYGLKQPPCDWFGRFATSVLNLGYSQCPSDHTLPVKRRLKILLVLLIV